jgi:hypothetical protein
MTVPYTSAMRIWTGDEWEGHIQLLLKHHYAPGEYQDVPARDGGDYGVEGFAREGTAYQCYAAEGILTTAQLYEKQRDKITVDLKKFVVNRVELTALFGVVRIRRWLLVVPEFRGPAIVEHGNRKAAEVRATGLSYVDDGFSVAIITDDEFAVARQRLAGVGLTQIRAPEPAETSDLNTWGSANSSLLDTLVAKAARLSTLADEGRRDQFVARMVQRYERGQFMIEHLRSNYPDIFERLIECKNARQRMLELETLTSVMPGGELMQRELRELRVELTVALPGVAPSTIADLVGEAVADWLMRCPLDFPAVA